jgi:hypothetical protein
MAIARIAIRPGEHGGQDDHAGMHGPAFERVVEILAVCRDPVQHRGIGRRETAGDADRRAGPAFINALAGGGEKVGAARGDADPRDVDQLGLRHRGGCRRGPGGKAGIGERFGDGHFDLNSRISE